MRSTLGAERGGGGEGGSPGWPDSPGLPLPDEVVLREDLCDAVRFWVVVRSDRVPRHSGGRRVGLRVVMIIRVMAHESRRAFALGRGVETVFQ